MISAARCTRALFDGGGPHLLLEVDRLAEADDRRLVALAERLERARNPYVARVETDDARLDPVVHARADEQDAVLLRAARPLVGAARVEVRLQLREVHIQHAERLCAVDQRERALFARHAADLADRQDVPTVEVTWVIATTLVAPVIARRKAST